MKHTSGATPCVTCGPHRVSPAHTERRALRIATREAARKAGKILVKACRAPGDDVQLQVGFEAVAAGPGFRRWNDAVAGLDAGTPRVWSDALCHARLLELVPDMDRSVADGALDVLNRRAEPRR